MTQWHHKKTELGFTADRLVISMTNLVSKIIKIQVLVAEIFLSTTHSKECILFLL